MNAITEKSEYDFQEWLSWRAVYINTDRYSSFGSAVVCVIDSGEDEKLADAVSNLDSGDEEMMEACDYIRSKPRWIGAGPLVEAVKAAEVMARDYYFKELNKKP